MRHALEILSESCSCSTILQEQCSLQILSFKVKAFCVCTRVCQNTVCMKFQRAYGVSVGFCMDLTSAKCLWRSVEVLLFLCLLFWILICSKVESYEIPPLQIRDRSASGDFKFYLLLVGLSV